MASPPGDLFAVAESRAPIALGAQACVLRGFAVELAPQLLAEVEVIAAAAPFRHLVTPGGRRMAVAMTCCGTLGWTSDARGYRYERADPLTGHAWPVMPAAFARLARDAAQAAGFDGFAPDSVLINRYVPGTKRARSPLDAGRGVVLHAGEAGDPVGRDCCPGEIRTLRRVTTQARRIFPQWRCA